MIANEPSPRHQVASDRPFLAAMVALGGSYLLLIAAMLWADISFLSPADLWDTLAREEVMFSLRLSLFTCTAAALLSLLVAVPLAYLMTRVRSRWLEVVELLVDIPVVLPPLVIGLSLLILFQSSVGRAIESVIPVTFEVPAIILAQFTVACAFSVRTMIVSFQQLHPRTEDVALTLGCSRAQAFFRVVLPGVERGMVTAFTLAWARSLGEFGPILVFAGVTRMRTEVLPTTVFLELNVGNIEAAVAASLLMITAAAVVLTLARLFGQKGAVR